MNKSIDTKFLLYFLIAGIAGFLFSNQLQIFTSWVMYLLMIILFVIFLKIDIFDLISHAKKAHIVLPTLIINLIIFPILTWFISKWFVDTQLLIALVLFASLPTGVAASAMTDILKGNTSLTLIMSVLSTILVMATIPIVFYTLFRTNVAINYGSLFIMLFKLIAFPLLLSQIAKLLLHQKQLEKIHRHSGEITRIVISLMFAIVISGETHYISSHISEVLYYTAVLYILFSFFLVISYYINYKLERADRIALTSAKTYMNITLGIGLAYLFFDPKVALIMVMGEIPWTTIIIFFNIFLKHHQTQIQQSSI